MANDPTLSMLLDIYCGMLTEKQRGCLDLFYNQDLSFSEIGNYYHITRQGACDFITRGRASLLKLEEKLGFLKKITHAQEKIDEIILLSEELINYNKSNSNSNFINEQSKKINELAQNISKN